MDLRYEAYCLADPVFYDSPATPTDTDTGFPATTGPIPEDWERTSLNVWVMLRPCDVSLRNQGWKIHVSSTLDNADSVLDAVWDYCIAHRVPFKFLRSRHALLAQNSKYADRGGSGKFVTIYPSDEDEMERVLKDLDERVGGQPGPYILSDLRWRSGPLYVRYGGFRERLCRSETGELVPGIEDPSGQLVPDVRSPSFQTPAWVTLPALLAEQVAARGKSTSTEEFPYRIEKALHFSNGGGVYLGRDTHTGDQVLIKEARPLAGLDRSGADAVARLDREHRVLERLAGLDCVPQVLDRRTWWEHHFLVREYVDGEPLNRHVVGRHPLLRPDATEDSLAEYTNWALELLGKVERGIEAMHARDIVFGDLHPANIIVRDDDTIGFIDFEVARDIGEPRRPTLGAPGFIAPAGYDGFDVDRYALGCLRLVIFMSLAPVIAWDASKVEQFIGLVADRFPVPPEFAEQVRRDRRPAAERDLPADPEVAAATRRRSTIWPERGLPEWEPIRASMTGAILSSATPERTDRLFPGDIEQFANGGGITMAHGAAGVLWALAETGAERSPEHEAWLLDATRRWARPRIGFYDGVSGIAFALDRVGQTEAAREFLTQLREAPLDPADITLQRGLAGLGLTYLHFAGQDSDRALLDEAAQVAERVIERLRDESTQPARPGFMQGAAGVALFLIRLYEATGDEALLDHAAAALHRDLAGCVWTTDRTLQADEGWRVVPYVATGSIGIGLVIHEFLRHREDPVLAEAQSGVRRAAEPEFVVQSGLFNGRAGLTAYLLHTRRDADDAREPIERHLRNLGWHAVSYEGRVAFIGDQLMRLSMDLGTGSAGVLLTLGVACTGRGTILPFLDRDRGETGSGQGREVSEYGVGS